MPKYSLEKLNWTIFFFFEGISLPFSEKSFRLARYQIKRIKLEKGETNGSRYSVSKDVQSIVVIL